MSSPVNNNSDLDQILKSNYREIIFKYIAHWKLFLVMVSFALGLSYLYLRYTIPQYEASITVMIKNNQKGGNGMSETSAFEDLTIFNDGLFIENEKSVLQSRRLMSAVVLDLELRKEYSRLGNYTGLKKVEAYSNAPFTVEYQYTDTLAFNLKRYSTNFVAHENNISEENDDGEILNIYAFDSLYALDDDISFKLKKSENFNSSIYDVTYKFSLLSLESCIDKYRGRLKIEQPSQNSTILKLSLTYNSKEKAVDILNKLIEHYNLDAIQDKNLVSANTEKFIAGRLSVISEELSFIEDSLKMVKSSNDLIDYQFESQYGLSQYKELQAKSLEANTQLILSTMMYDHITNNQKAEDLIPVNLGFDDPTIELTIREHNKLVIERIEALKNSTEKNPKIKNLTFRINEIKSNISRSIQNIINAKKQIVQQFERKENSIDQNIARIPQFEKDLRAIKREQEIK